MENQSKILINSSQKVSPEEIVLLSADPNYTQVHFLNGRKSIYPLMLKSIETQFIKVGFFRTHKSFLVNLQFFKKVHWGKANSFMILSNDYRVSIARRKKKNLRRILHAMSEVELDDFNSIIE